MVDPFAVAGVLGTLGALVFAVYQFRQRRKLEGKMEQKSAYLDGALHNLDEVTEVTQSLHGRLDRGREIAQASLHLLTLELLRLWFDSGLPSRLEVRFSGELELYQSQAIPGEYTAGIPDMKNIARELRANPTGKLRITNKTELIGQQTVLFANFVDFNEVIRFLEDIRRIGDKLSEFRSAYEGLRPELFMFLEEGQNGIGRLLAKHLAARVMALEFRDSPWSFKKTDDIRQYLLDQFMGYSEFEAEARRIEAELTKHVIELRKELSKIVLQMR